MYWGRNQKELLNDMELIGPMVEAICYNAKTILKFNC
jgi:hypothetical protein